MNGATELVPFNLKPGFLVVLVPSILVGCGWFSVMCHPCCAFWVMGGRYVVDVSMSCKSFRRDDICF
jgi:hypothetical protein